MNLEKNKKHGLFKPLSQVRWNILFDNRGPHHAVPVDIVAIDEKWQNAGIVIPGTLSQTIMQLVDGRLCHYARKHVWTKFNSDAVNQMKKLIQLISANTSYLTSFRHTTLRRMAMHCWLQELKLNDLPMCFVLLGKWWTKIPFVYRSMFEMQKDRVYGF